MAGLSQTPTVNQSKEVKTVISKIDEFGKPDGVFSDNEKTIINNLYKKVKTVEGKKQVKDYISTHYTGETKSELSDLLGNVEVQVNNFGFKSLEKSFEKDQNMKEFFNIIGEYIDLNLDTSFSDSEKDKIKLVMIGEIQSELNISSVVGVVIKDLLEPLKDMINIFNGDKEIGEKADQLKETSIKIQIKFSEIFKSFGLDGKVKEINLKIEKINTAKKQNKDFKSLGNVLDVLGLQKGKTEKEIFDSIKNNTKELSKKLSGGKDVGSFVKKGIEGLPFDLGDDIKGFLRGLVKDYPILGMIFSMFFGKEFLDESADKGKKSIQNLQKLSKTNDFLLKDNIKSKDLEKFDIKKLEVFFKFLDSKKIDYSTDTFWQEFLSGTSKNVEINNLIKLLKTNDKKILLKDEKLEVFIKKLNSLENLEQKQEAIKNKQQKQKLEKDSTQIITQQAKLKKETDDLNKIQKDIQTKERKKLEIIEKIKKENQELENNSILSVEQKKDKQKELIKKQQELEEKVKELAKDKRLADLEKKKAEEKAKELAKKAEKVKIAKEKLDFENSILNISSLPTNIDYKGEKLNLNIKNNKIILGNKEYNISIDTRFGNRFESIEFKNGNFILNKDTIITKNQVIGLIKDLQEKGSFSLKGKKDKGFFGIVKYEIKIT